MRKLAAFLLLLLPLISRADSSSHPIVPGVHFGMPSQSAIIALRGFRGKYIEMGAGLLRYHLITTSAQPGKLTALDKSVPTYFDTNHDPKLAFVTCNTMAQAAGAYESVHTAWTVYKDICECKFKRLGGPGTFPELAEFGEATKDITTDLYEAEGMRIELIVRSVKLEGMPIQYTALLKIVPAESSASTAAK